MVYKKIKSQSNNPCACQDRTKQTHQNIAMYIFICCYRAGLAVCFRTKTLTHSQIGREHLKTHQKKKKLENDKSSYELNIDNSKTKFANLFTLITY